jgi:putative transposase
MSLDQKRHLIRRENTALSIVKQCDLLDIHRSGIYFKPKAESSLNLNLMRLIDEKFIDCPFYGVPRMTTWLKEDKGYSINHKRIERLYKTMGLQTIFPKKNLSKRNQKHKIYPYLLKNLQIVRSNQVWQTDITYIPLERGFMYMVAIIDVFSRKVLNWSISNTMNVEWCQQVYEDAIKQYGSPEIINTDQGSQFTSPIFTKVSLDREIKISMDGKGRALDNIYIERFWRALKYEHIYLNPANGGVELYEGVRKYIEFYNTKRRHTSINNNTPEKYFNPINTNTKNKPTFELSLS